MTIHGDHNRGCSCGLNPPVSSSDLAAVALVQSQYAEALAIASALDEDTRSVRAWLWEPHSLPDSPAIIMYGSAEDWLNRLRTPIAEPS